MSWASASTISTLPTPTSGRSAGNELGRIPNGPLRPVGYRTTQEGHLRVAFLLAQGQHHGAQLKSASSDFSHPLSICLVDRRRSPVILFFLPPGSSDSDGDSV